MGSLTLRSQSLASAPCGNTAALSSGDGFCELPTASLRDRTTFLRALRPSSHLESREGITTCVFAFLAGFLRASLRRRFASGLDERYCCGVITAAESRYRDWLLGV